MNHPQTLKQLAAFIIYYLDITIPLLILIAVLIYVGGTAWGIFRVGSGKIKMAEGRNNLLWGIAILFVMVSIWGIMRLLQSALFGANGSGNSGVQPSTQNVFQYSRPIE